MVKQTLVLCQTLRSWGKNLKIVLNLISSHLDKVEGKHLTQNHDFSISIIISCLDLTKSS